MLDDIVDLTITLESNTPTKAGFGTILLAGYHTKWLDYTKVYSKAADLLTDGFTTSDILYLAAVALKSQSPCPKNFKVGRLASAPAQVVRLIPVVTGGVANTYSGKINDLPFTFTTDASPTVAEATAGIAAAITALAGVTATDDTTHVTSTTDAAGAVLKYTELSSNLLVKDMSTAANIATDLASIYAADSDWYGLYLVNQSETIIDAAAAWVEANKKLFVYDSADSDIANLPSTSTTDVGSDLKGSDYFRTGGNYHRDIPSFVMLGIMSGRFTAVAGSDTWAFKSVKGPAPSSLTTAVEQAVQGKNVNTYTTVKGSNILYPGKVASGEYFDQVRGIDALQDAIQTAVLGAFVANERIDYTNEGVALMTGVIQGVLEKYAAAPIKFLTPESILVTAPRVEDVDDADKAARLLPDVEFSATLRGAIHAITIRGKLVI